MENQITVVDLARVRTIIETACTRGAFQASEMRAVGEVYDRLTAFLASITQQAAEQDQSNQGETP